MHRSAPNHFQNQYDKTDTEKKTQRMVIQQTRKRGDGQYEQVETASLKGIAVEELREEQKEIQLIESGFEHRDVQQEEESWIGMARGSGV